MLKFVFRRLTYSLPVLFGIFVVTFTLARAIPGDPCLAVLGERATKDICESFFRRNGLDQPAPIQLLIYMRNFAQGDLGDSLRFHRPVMELLVDRLPTTVELGFFALLFAISVGVPLGVLSAYRHKSALDVGTMIGANVGVSMPVFWLGLMLAYLFAVLLKDTPLALPPSGRLTPGANPEPFYLVLGWVAEGEEPLGILRFFSRINTLNAVLTLNSELLIDALRHLILPAVAVGTIPLAIIARMSRSSVLEVSQPGLRPHSARQGPARTLGRGQARPEERHAAGYHRHRAELRAGHQRRGIDRDHLQLDRRRSHAGRQHHLARLHAGTRLHGRDRGWFRAHQYGGGYALRLP